MFVVVEGPNGVGKSTVVSALADVLVAAGERVHRTAEPSSTSLGKAIRELQATMPPTALALSCAADRYDHITREVEPQLSAGTWVVCDRYVPSSLVLQRLDGLDLEWIWALNEAVLRPDLTVYLEDDPQTISLRIHERGQNSRFETNGSPTVELDYYRDAHAFLARRGWRQTIIDCRSRTPTEIAAEVTAQLH